MPNLCDEWFRGGERKIAWKNMNLYKNKMMHKNI